MAYDLTNYLVIGISSRALFDLEEENILFDKDGLVAYTQFQIANERSILKPGTGFPLVQAILNLNKKIPGKRKVEVVILSRNNAATSLRIFNSIKHYGLDITRSAWTGGNSLVPYLRAFKVDLFLSANEVDVQEAVNSGTAAGKIYQQEQPVDPVLQQIRIAFVEHERINAAQLLPEGPFAKLLKTISFIQSEFDVTDAPIRTALVTARNSPTHERVIRTLNHWKVRIDEAFFLGGIEKQHVLKAFKAHIFFDDQDIHCSQAASYVPTARVPYIQEQTPFVDGVIEPTPSFEDGNALPTGVPPIPTEEPNGSQTPDKGYS